MPGFGVFRPKNVHQRRAGLEDRDGAERIQPVYGAGNERGRWYPYPALPHLELHRDSWGRSLRCALQPPCNQTRALDLINYLEADDPFRLQSEFPLETLDRLGVDPRSGWSLLFGIVNADDHGAR